MLPHVYAGVPKQVMEYAPGASSDIVSVQSFSNMHLSTIMSLSSRESNTQTKTNQNYFLNYDTKMGKTCMA